jgi:poly[(R)-3-hydroxyalkanoate] polymerase subunit PhaE
VSNDPLGMWQAFGEAARNFLGGAGKTQPPDAAARFSDFLREQFASLVQPWRAVAEAAPASANARGSFDAPAFGATREHQQRAQRMAEAVSHMEAAQLRLQRLWSDVLRDAATSFVAHLRPGEVSASSAQDVRKLYDRWIDCAEDAYSRVAHGEAFCQAQAELLNAGSQWRQEQQANFEHLSKLLDLPTRSEVNTLTRRLRDIEKKLRTMSAPTSTSTSTPTPTPTPTPIPTPTPTAAGPAARARASASATAPRKRAKRSKKKS